jgi:hypothetical protein
MTFNFICNQPQQRMAIIARGIRYLDIDDAVDLDGDVVLGDGLLVVDGEGFLLERMDIGDSINERDQRVDPGADTNRKTVY